MRHVTTEAITDYIDGRMSHADREALG